MLTQNAYNRRITEHLKTDDIYEDAIKVDAINSTHFERHLARVNTGIARRADNGHQERLAAYKAGNTSKSSKSSK